MHTLTLYTPPFHSPQKHTTTPHHHQCKLAGLAGEGAVKALEACLSASSLGSEASRCVLHDYVSFGGSKEMNAYIKECGCTQPPSPPSLTTTTHSSPHNQTPPLNNTHDDKTGKRRSPSRSTRTTRGGCPRLPPPVWAVTRGRGRGRRACQSVAAA